MDFAQFYQHGGVFMHVITLLSFIVGGVMLRRAGTIRRTFQDPKQQLDRLRRGNVLTPALLVTTVMVGLLGAGLGMMAVDAALQTVPAEHMAMAQARGEQIAMYPLIWSLVCAVPLTLGHGLMRYFEVRLRDLIEARA